MKTVQVQAKIISNKRFKENYWHLEFESAIIAKNALPGQFVNIKVGKGLEPLLRRPISIHAVGGVKVKLFYQAVGIGTQILSQRKSGELLDIIGALGSGFNYHRMAQAKKVENILVAGGMGVAPLFFLAQRLASPRMGSALPRAFRPRSLRRCAARNDTIVLIGAKTKKQVLCEQEFKKLGCTLKLATDDGSLGFKGKVTDLLKDILDQHKPAGLFSCGPHSMLKVVSEIARENKINAQLSLEEHMACGLGACLGCAVSTKGGYKRVCKDGPVFSSGELIW